MKRKKNIVLVAHCILNVNAKVYGIATEPGGCTSIVCALLREGYGIIQLPCIEQSCCGSNRWGQVKEQLNFPAFRSRCRELLTPILQQTKDFYENGYKINGIVGLDGSPSCGVASTCSGSWGGELGQGFGVDEKLRGLRSINEPGVMMEVLSDMLCEYGMEIPFLSVDESDPDKSAEELIDRLKKVDE